MMPRPVRQLAAPVVLAGLLMLAGCSEVGPRTLPEPEPAPTPRLVKVSTSSGLVYSRVILHFEPGTRELTADVAEVDNAVAGLAGEQALRITVPATAENTAVTPVGSEAAAVAELRVVPAGGDKVRVLVGIDGAGDLSVRIFEIDSGRLAVAVRDPRRLPDPQVSHDCGSIESEPGKDSGAFDIVARGVGCMVAREVAARAEGRLGSAYETPSGFECVPRSDSNQSTPTVRYTCTRGSASIRFTTS